MTVKKKKSTTYQEHITIKGAYLHNLKHIDVKIPRNKLVVITGLSGSGKSTLAFDTLYAEGQRRYVESLSSYARQFLGKHNKPKVAYIKGIAPAIAIEQKVNSSNPRSTVGTTTEIYDYLKLLFARVGKTYSPISGNEVKKHTVKDVVTFIKSLEEKSKLLLLAPYTISKEKEIEKVIPLLAQQGFARIKTKKEILRLDTIDVNTFKDRNFSLVIDRIITKNDEDFYNRLADSIQTAFYEGKGTLYIENLKKETIDSFSNTFELDGILFPEPNTHLFSFNNPYGACEQCEGYGNVIGIDENLVVPNTTLSVFDEAIAPWRTNSYKKFHRELLKNAYKFEFPIHRPWFELSDEEKNVLWNGNTYFKGIHAFFDKIEAKNYKIQNRVLLSRYRGKTTCPSCNGSRLNNSSKNVKINQKSIHDLIALPLDELALFFQKLNLNKQDFAIAKRLLDEIVNRIDFLNNVGLNYLHLNRASNTLSGGESQRINLATSLGSSLVGSMYILDEPSIGLHPKDTEKLITVLLQLRDLGNTVIVVEHDPDIMKAADYIIDIGPEAGSFGGEVVGEGNYKELLTKNSLTAKYLSGDLKIEIPKKRRESRRKIVIEGARENNLKNITVDFPLHVLTVVTGVSGSGKSTLVGKLLYPLLQKHIQGYGNTIGDSNGISGDLDIVKYVEYISQNPIGKSSRSNPVTYIKAYDDIRQLFASQALSKIRNFQAKHFSFNVDGGRCETCKGEGTVTIEMQFMADVHLECEECKGKRFKKEVLEVTFANKNIDDILRLTVDEAISFFEETEQKKLVRKIKNLQDVGLGYVALGQASSTLSGGEAQRIKLAFFLSKGKRQEKSIFIFDEPTTGLHFHDIKKLLKAFDALIENGHTIIVVEHNIDLIKSADYIIDLGKEGGKNGGHLLFQGRPEGLKDSSISYTAKYLKEALH